MAAFSRPSGPWGGAALRAFSADVAKGWPAGLTVLTGDDVYHLDRAQKLLLDHLVPGGDPYSLSIVGDEPVGTGALVGAARSLGMFAPRRVILLRDVSMLEGDPDPLIAYAAKPPAASWIVVRAPKLDRKRKLHKALAEAGACVTFRRPSGDAEFRDLATELKSMAAGRSVTLDAEAAGLLIDVCGPDLYRIEAEIEKLAAYLGEAGGKAGFADVRALVAGSGLLSGWELADALTERDTEGAVAAGRRLLEAGEEPIRMLGGLASRARSLLKAKAMESSGRPAKDVVDAVRAWYFRDALDKGLKRYTLEELLAFPAKMYEADKTFKSRAIDKGAVLETLVVSLTHGAAGKAPMTGTHELVLILDFGSQYTQLIARRVRELGVYCEVVPYHASLETIRARRPKGIILSGGPDSVYDAQAPQVDEALFALGAPVLGICYGMQLMMRVLGGDVRPAAGREYGPATVEVLEREACLFRGLGPTERVWASHGDHVHAAAPGFRRVAASANAPCAGVEDEERRLYGVQFHPEVVHTEHGREVLKNFLFGACGCRGDWTIASFVEEAVAEVRRTVGSERVVCALSGGVDSSVMALLLHKALGANLICIFVNNGVLRKGEAEQVVRDFRERYKLEVRYADEAARFLGRLKGVEEPERKRKIIGETFIEVFEEHAQELGGISFLAQGTIYPDRIESASVKGPSATIKTHHNVGGLPERMNMRLVEPLKDLFKDEVRRVGEQLGLDPAFVRRHPFPGPGLAVRVLGEVTAERVAILQNADAVFLEELRAAGEYDAVSQAFAVLLPVKSVGVMGDYRTYENVVALRAVATQDFMTADWSRLPYDLLARVSSRIVNEVRGVNRVVYDVTSKPPGTIEWE